MKKYLSPEMEIELFDGKDLFSYATIEPGCGGDCTQNECPDDSCPEYDLDWNPPCPAEWGGGPEIFG